MCFLMLCLIVCFPRFTLILLNGLNETLRWVNRSHVQYKGYILLKIIIFYKLQVICVTL